MKNLKEDIEKIVATDKHSFILFKVKSYFEAIEMLNQLNRTGYLSNYKSWIDQREIIKEAFDNSAVDCIELNLIEQRLVYYSKDRFDKLSIVPGKYILETSDYIFKMPRVKLEL